MSRTNVLLTVTLLAGALSSLIVFIMLYGGHKPALSAFAVSVGPVPASMLYTIDAKSGTLTTLLVSVGEGQELPALDVQPGPDGSWYYMLAEPSPTPLSNLYVRHADGSIEKLTDSATAKYNLSYNEAQGGKLAYQSTVFTDDEDFITNQVWDLVVYDLATGEETVVGAGMKPHLTKDGAGIMFHSGKELAFLALGTDVPVTVMEFPSGVPYAISPDAENLAVYNPTTRKIDTYALTYSASPSYVSSIEAGFMPLTLGYVHERLVAAYASVQDGEYFYTFSDLTRSGQKPRVVKGLSFGFPQRIYGL